MEINQWLLFSIWVHIDRACLCLYLLIALLCCNQSQISISFWKELKKKHKVYFILSICFSCLVTVDKLMILKIELIFTEILTQHLCVRGASLFFFKTFQLTRSRQSNFTVQLSKLTHIYIHSETLKLFFQAFFTHLNWPHQIINEKFCDRVDFCILSFTSIVIHKAWNSTHFLNETKV